MSGKSFENLINEIVDSVLEVNSDEAISRGEAVSPGLSLNLGKAKDKIKEAVDTAKKKTEEIENTAGAALKTQTKGIKGALSGAKEGYEKETKQPDSYAAARTLNAQDKENDQKDLASKTIDVLKKIDSEHPWAKYAAGAALAAGAGAVGLRKLLKKKNAGNK